MNKLSQTTFYIVFSIMLATMLHMFVNRPAPAKSAFAECLHARYVEIKNRMPEDELDDTIVIAAANQCLISKYLTGEWK